MPSVATPEDMTSSPFDKLRAGERLAEVAAILAQPCELGLSRATPPRTLRMDTSRE